MLLGTHILTIVRQFVPQLATWNLCLYVGTDSIVRTILDYVGYLPRTNIAPFSCRLTIQVAHRGQNRRDACIPRRQMLVC